nr:zinc finger, CCHC-type [Tanacetum cinerariifolium]
MQYRDASFWKKAIDDEIGSIMDNNAWVLFDLPTGCKPLGCKWIFKRKMKVDGCKWIFKRKMKVDGTIDNFKARLVIQGFRQKEGIDYFDTYAPVARITTIRLLLALTAIHNLVIHQMNVKTTFLKGDLDENVYMKRPEGFFMSGNEHKVCKLVKSLYGLKQAPKQWYQKFDEVVLSSGFHLNQSDKCVYSKFDDSGKGVIICLYVDDMLIFGTDQNQVDKTKKFLSSRFSMKDIREADVILGIKIKRENKRIWMVFLIGRGVISWASKKQTCITGSTMESEFVALAATVKMASLDNAVNNKDYEQVKVGTGSGPGEHPVKGSESDTRVTETVNSTPPTAVDSEFDTENGETVKSTPPATGNNTEAANKRKRVSEDATSNDEKQTKTAKDTPVANTTTESEENHFTAVETTTGVKEVEMVDAETIQGSVEQGIKEVEMQDAEVVYNETRIEEKINKDERPDVQDEDKITKDERPDVRDEGKTHPDINKDETGPNLSVTEGFKQDEGIKETDKPNGIGGSESNERSINDAAANDGSGQQVLGEVATLLKQVQDSDAKAKLEVDVKVKKMDQGDVKENGEVSNHTQTAARVSCP